MKKNRYKQIAIALIIPILLILIIEFTLRTFGVEINTGKGDRDGFFYFEIVSKNSPTDRDINIETGPYLHSIDSKTYKCKYKNFNKKNNEYIILTIGDSCTYGLGAEKSYSYYLENILNKSKNNNINYKVYNFGFPGYSSFQGLMFLKKYLYNINPDYIIAWFGANDAVFAPFYTDEEFCNAGKLRLRLIEIHKKLYKEFRLYRLLSTVNTNYVRKIVSKSFDNPNKNKYRKVRVSPKEFNRNLKKMQNIARSKNIDIIFIQHCWLIDGKLLRQNNYQPPLDYMDLHATYINTEEKIESLYADHCHPSDLGHKIIAQELAKKILGITKNNTVR